ncbi:MAG: hypothetical protein U9N62_13120 [Thermotogota bacterium]|nr:hypothetical protein [Thermotogota bacterium]
MKKFLILMLMVTMAITLSFGQLGTDVYVGYNLGIKTMTAGSTDVTFFQNDTEFTGQASQSTSFIDLGLLVDYEIADGFSIGAGVGGAVPIMNTISYRTGGSTDTAKAAQYALDGIIGVNYSYPLEPVMLKADLIGGVSFLDLNHMGYMVKAKFGIGYDIGGFTISLGAGYELRNYTIKLAEAVGTPGALSFNSIPIELGITLRF